MFLKMYQVGDPQKLTEALIQLAKLEHPPARFAARADADETFEAKAKVLNYQANALREFSSSLSLDTD
ncbi:hypothetical protein [Erwinia billingiae]|uniref:hypothetical protein n=1 Tax=Erwinia billingiae TaxID=182337 RepID=UPI0017859413|nr:hypothetical protein [Erwinia billingiae]